MTHSGASTPVFAHIVARGRNGVIGAKGDLPWRLSTDLKHFKRTTQGKPVLMGRKTWESLGRALPGRPNLVLTRDERFTAEGAEVFHTLETMLARGRALSRDMGVDDVMIIGGAQLYEATLERTQRLYLTDVDAHPDGGDAFYPAITEAQWTEVARQAFPAGPRDEHSFVVRTLERR